MAGEREVLQAIVDANDQPVFAVDRDLRYLAFNGAHAAVMRRLYGAEIAVGGRIGDYQTVAADRSAATANLERALAGERVVAGAESGEAGRGRRFFDVVHTPLTDAAGAVVGVVVSAHDSTQRLSVDLRTTLDSMLDPHVVLQAVRDDSGAIVDFVFADANAAACEFNRLPHDELVGLPLLESHPAVGTTGLFDFYVHVVETGEPLVLDGWSYPQDLLGGELRRYDVRATRLGDGLGQTWRDVTERHAMARELDDERQRFKLLVEKSGEAFLLSQPDGTIHFANPQACGMFGRTEEEIRALGRDGLVDATDPRVAAGLRERARTGRFTGELRLVRRDGTTFEGEISTSVYVDHLGAERTSTVIRDLTERKAAEAELREAPERLDLAQRASGTGIWDWDVVTGSIEWSPEMFELFGLDAARIEAGFDSWNGALHPDDLEVANARIATALAEHEVLDSEYRIVRPGGEVRWINALGQGFYDDRGEPVRMSGICLDVTERRRTEEQLRETRDYLESLFGYANAPVIVWDPALRITRFNHAFEELTQRRAEEVVGRHIELLFPDDERRMEALGRITSATAGERWQVVEIPILRADGEVRTVLWNSATIYEADGATPTATIAQGQDITERIAAEAEIRRLNAHLERRVDERTRALRAANSELEEFVYSVAHDLRSPLRALSGFSELVQADYGDLIDDTGRDYLRRIRNAALHLGDLMDALLSLSRVAHRELELKDVDLSALARGVAERLRDADPERAAELAIEDGLVVRSDPALCEIVVENLLANAWKFSAAASPARISLRVACIDGERTYVVSDNGVGFDPQYAGKLFTPFERLHTADQFPGTGIGLATVRRAVTRVGGRCWAEGDADGGARFYFSLGEPC